MMKSLISLWSRLSFVALLSILLGSQSVVAHENNPTVADFEVVDGQLKIDMRLNIEAFLADLDLDDLEDTDAAPEADQYDALQAESGEVVKQMFYMKSDDFLNNFKILSGGLTVKLKLGDVATPEDSLPDIARLSRATFSAELADNQEDLVFDWGAGNGLLVIRQNGVEEPYTGIITGGSQSPAISIYGEEPPTWFGTFVEFIPVGFDHILPKGLDHILFVLGLFFLSLRLGALLTQVTAFTAAHTITLALGALGIVNIPGSIVEPLIAASIVYVGIENVFATKVNRWRTLIVLLFGLLHGLGFASVLGDFGLPESHFIAALLGFNVGVEFGQLTVIAGAFLAVGLWFGKKPWYKPYISNPASLLIAAVGAYWFVERVFL